MTTEEMQERIDELGEENDTLQGRIDEVEDELDQKTKEYLILYDKKEELEDALKEVQDTISNVL